MLITWSKTSYRHGWDLNPGLFVSIFVTLSQLLQSQEWSRINFPKKKILRKKFALNISVRFRNLLGIAHIK